MATLVIERVQENSDYVSRIRIEWLRDIGMLRISIGDNNGIDVMMCLEEAETRALQAYLEGEL